MARTGAFARGGRTHELQLSLLRVQTIGEDLIKSLVGHDEEAAKRVEFDLVRLCKWLLDAMRPELSFEFDEIGHFAERSVFAAGQHRERRGDVVCYNDVPVGRIDRKVHGVLALRALPIDDAQHAGLLVHAHGGDIAQIAVHRIKKTARAIKREIRRVDEFGEQLDMRPAAGRVVHAVDVKSVATGVPLFRRACADIDEGGCTFGHAAVL